METSVFFDELLHHPFQVLQEIFSFLQKKKLDNMLVTTLLKDCESLLKKAQKESDFYKHLSIPQSVYTHAASIINDELASSNDLSQWPCKSFKDLERLSKALLQKNPNLSLTPYYDLSADCRDPFVKCSVKFDINEQKPV